MTIQQLLSDPKLLAQYAKWRNQEMTQLVISILKESFGNPIAPAASVLTEHTAEWSNGFQNGKWDVIQRIANLDVNQPVVEPEVTYQNTGGKDA